MPRAPRPVQCRSWLFTLNNYSEDEYRSIQSWCTNECDYAVIGKEVGEEGTPHLQGYFRKKVKCRLSSLKDSLSGRAHFEAARGSQATTVRIVQRMETSGKPVRVPTPEDERIETSSQSSGSPLSRIVAPMSSAAQTLAASLSPDIRCYETVWDLPRLSIDPTSPSSGSGENLVLESQDWPTNDFLEHILKSPERSGGLDTCWSQMSS